MDYRFNIPSDFCVCRKQSFVNILTEPIFSVKLYANWYWNYVWRKKTNVEHKKFKLKLWPYIYKKFVWHAIKQYFSNLMQIKNKWLFACPHFTFRRDGVSLQMIVNSFQTYLFFAIVMFAYCNLSCTYC